MADQQETNAEVEAEPKVDVAENVASTEAAQSESAPDCATQSSEECCNAEDGEDSASEAMSETNTSEEEQIPAAALMASLEDMTARLDELTRLFKSKISRSVYEEQVLKRYSDEMQEYKADLFKKITLPLIKEIIGVRDATISIVKRAKNDESNTGSVDIESVEFIGDMLETALDNYGVSVHAPELGKQPIKLIERPIGRVETGSRELHGTIAAIMNDAYLMDDKCIAPARVKLYAYSEALAKQSAPTPDNASGSACKDAASTTDVDTTQDSMPEPAPVYNPE